MPDLPPISVELQGKISDLMAKFAIVKQEIRSLQDVSTRGSANTLADKMLQDMRSGLIRNAIKKQMTDNGTVAGDSFWSGFKRAWQRGLKQENADRGFWGNLSKWGLPFAPAAIPALSGLAGILGGLATAGVGAAAGLGALRLAAKEVLGPVQQAFQTFDQYATASGKTSANLISSNATALKTWMAAGKTVRFTPTLHLRRVTPNVLPKGMGFIANPQLDWLKLTPAQRRRVILQSQTTMTGLPSAYRSQIGALMQERQIYSGLTPGQRTAFFQTRQFDTALSGAETAAAPSILKLYGAGLSALSPVLKYITPLANAAAQALMPLVKEVGTGFQSQGFKDFVGLLVKMAKLGIAKFGQALIDFGIGLGHIFGAFAKSNIPGNVLNNLVKMADHFRNWTASKGFASFMAGLKTTTPIVSGMLKNLQQILAKIIGSMATGIGVWELKGLNFLLTILNGLVHLPGVGHLVGNLIALQLVLSRFGAVRAEGFLFGALGKQLAKLIPGITVVDGKITGFGKLWGGIWTKVTGAAKTAALAVWGSIKSIIGAIAAASKAALEWAIGMAAKMAAAVGAWILGWVGIDAATVSGAAVITVGTGGIVLAIGLIVLAIYELVKHWKTVWGWIKKVGEDAWNFIYNGFGKYLLPLLGPVGVIALATIELYKHWKTIWGDICTVVDGARKLIELILLNIVLKFADWAKSIVHLAADAFGWIPGLGGKLKAADKSIGDFVANTQASLNKLTKPHNVPVSINVGFDLPKGVSSHDITGIRGQLAGGTSSARPGWHIVGEKGPELAFMRGGEQVIPNHKLGGLAGGTTGYLNWAVGVPGARPVELGISTINTLATRVGQAVAAKVKSTAHLTMSLGGGGSPGFGIAPNGPLQKYAQALLKAYGWGNQWGFFNDIVMRESGWNVFARNPSSGAYGIPQALPPGKMASAGADWATNGFTQLRWMMGYLKSRWGSPFNADMNEIANHWYGSGGRIPAGSWGIVGERGTPEMVSVGSRGATITPLAAHGAGGRPILIQIFTNEINPVQHAAQLGFELARRSA